MKKIILFMIAGCGIIINPFHYVHAQNECNICNGAHPTLTQYQSFVLDVLHQIQTHTPTGPETYHTPGLFQDEVLHTSNTNIADKSITQLTKNIKSDVQTSIAIISIFAGESMRLLSQDLLPGLGLVISNSTLQRDMDMLLDLDERIVEKKLQLGLAGSFFQSPTEQDVQAFLQIGKKYEGYLLLPQDDENEYSFYVSKGSDISYGSILKLLQKIQGKMKRFVTYGGAGGLVDEDLQTIKKITINNGQVMITFDPASIIQMREDYKCVRGIINKCDSNTQTFGKKINNIAKNGYKKFKESIKRFVDSGKKLGTVMRNTNFFSRDTSQLQDECDMPGLPAAQKGCLEGDKAQCENYNKIMKKGKIACQALTTLGEVGNSRNGLLYNEGGGRIRSNIDDKISQGYNSFIEGTKIAKKGIKNGIILGKDVIDRIRNVVKKITHQQIDQKDTLTSYNISSSLEQELVHTMENTLQGYRQSQQHSIISDPKDITQSFPPLYANIQIMIDTIGNKETKHSLIQNLGSACEKQCANVGGICRY